MTATTSREPKRCATCGKGHFRRTMRAGRFEEYKGLRVELPADIALVECDACHEIIMSPKDMDLVEPIVEEAYRSHLKRVARSAIDTLVEEERTVGEVEKRLHLSTGYLSRVRTGSADPGYQLVALLALLQRTPGMLRQLDTLVANATDELTSTAAKPKRARK